MKLTALSLALIAALGMTAGCSTQGTFSQAPRQAIAAIDAQAQYAIGRFYQGQQRYEQAIDAYGRVLAANPGHVGAHNGLGASLLLAGRNAEAIEQFKAGLRHQPRSAALWNNLGYAYALNGENGLAEMAYKQSLELDPTDYKTSTNLAAVRQSLARTASAAPARTETEEVAAVGVVAAAEPARGGAADIAAPVEAAPAAITEAAEPVPTAAMQEKAATPDGQATPAMQLQPSTELAATSAAPVQIVKVAPRVYEVNLSDPAAGNIASAQAQPPAAPVAGAAHISIPLRDNAIQLASANSDDFVLEIRNGNGVRHMALRTSQYLAEQGYTTRRLTNQRGFNVRVTRVFYLPGYIEEATRLLAHLPKDTVLTETSNLRRGIHVRVVLGKDMAQHQAALDAAKEKIQLAALQP